MASIKPRGRVPKKASVNEIIEIKTLIRHPMHSGRMRDTGGKKIPRQIIKANKDIKLIEIPTRNINPKEAKSAIGIPTAT